MSRPAITLACLLTIACGCRIKSPPLPPHPDLALTDAEFDAKYLPELVDAAKRYERFARDAAKKAKEPGPDQDVRQNKILTHQWTRACNDAHEAITNTRARIRQSLAEKPGR